MKVAGIIAEYDPFHNGHAYHIAATKAAGATHIIVVLGGSFTQRGEPALLPVDARVKMAMAGGADLVIALPQPWACADAQGFARGGVSLLESTGCVDMLSFGSECGNIYTIQQAVTTMAVPSYGGILRKELESGISFAAAQEQAVAKLAGPAVATILHNANDTLGVAYCHELLHLTSSIKPFTVIRKGAEHNSNITTSQYAAAGHLRRAVRQGDPVASYMPSETHSILREYLSAGHALTDIHLADRILLSAVRQTDRAHFARLPGVSEGLENRLYTAVRRAVSLQEAIDAVKTKRYTQTRLQRIMTAAFLDIPPDLENQLPPYIRVLGMNMRGEELLHRMKTTATLPLFCDPMQPPADAYSQAIFAIERKAEDLYGSLLPTPTPCGHIFTVGMLH